MTTFRSHPDPSEWDNYVDFESTSWPKKDRRRYWIIPSICFNCESACGILAYVDQETLEVRKIEGNPVHPGSRGRTCAKGVVTPNQLDDPDRILYPLRRAGERGEGRWEQVSWNEALDDIGGRIRRAILEGLVALQSSGALRAEGEAAGKLSSLMERAAAATSVYRERFPAPEPGLADTVPVEPELAPEGRR